MITPVPSMYASAIWPKVVHLVRPAIEYVDTGFSEDDIRKRVAVADMQLWVVDSYKAACVTQLVNYPQHRACRVVALGGDGFEEWFDELMETVESWAKDNGCRYVEEYGRKGWVKAAAKRGYEHVYTVCRKEVA